MILNDFEILSILDSGGTSKVFKTKYKMNSKIYAMKTIDKNVIINSKNVIRENEISQTLKHPFIIRLYSSFEDKDKIYFILKYAPNSNLYNYVKNNTYNLNCIKFIFVEVLLGMEYLHKNKIILRDLKLENILIGKDKHILITDFGLAKYFKDKGKSLCGTPEYMAPEIIREEIYDEKIDIWSLGIVLYELCYKTTPFANNSNTDLFLHILQCKYTIPTVDGEYNDANDLIKKLLIIDPRKRLAIDKIKNHKFLEDVNYDDYLKKKIQTPIKIKKNKNEISITGFKPYESSKISPRAKHDLYKVVIIDDDSTSLTANSKILNKFGLVNTKTYSNGHIALNYIENNKTIIDLILLDLVMPNIDGNQVINNLINKKINIPIILLTGNIKDSKDTDKTNVVGYIKKPLRPISLHKNIVLGSIYQKQSLDKLKNIN